MRRLTSALLAFSLFATPAFAAFESPMALLQSLRDTTKPMDSSMEFHLNMQDQWYAAAWLKAESEGGRTADMKANAKMTIDIAGNGGTLRIRTSVRMVNRTVYAFIDGIDGTYDHELFAAAAQLKTKKWFSFTIDEQTANDLFNNSDEDAFLQVADQILTLVRTDSKTGSTYSMELKDAAALQQALGGDAMDLSQLNLHIKADTSKDDTLRGVKFYVSGSDPQEQASFVLQGTATPRTKPVTVQVPEGSIDVEQAIQELENANPFGEPALPSFPDDSDTQWESSSSSEESSMSSGVDCDPATLKGLSNIRKGQCGAQ